MQTGATQTGGKKVAGTKTATPPTPPPTPPSPPQTSRVQATGYLAQIYWPPPCALRNLNNFAKANKTFCRFWCLGLRDANIGGVAVGGRQFVGREALQVKGKERGKGKQTLTLVNIIHRRDQVQDPQNNLLSYHTLVHCKMHTVPN